MQPETKKPEEIDFEALVGVLEDTALDSAQELCGFMGEGQQSQAAAEFLASLGQANMSVLPTAYVLNLQATALLHAGCALDTTAALAAPAAGVAGEAAMSTLLQQLQQLAPLAAQATAGPWEVILNSDRTDSVHTPEANHTENFGLGDFQSSNLCMNTGGFAHDADAAYIAAARNLLTPENLRIIRACVKVVMDSQPAL